MKIKSSLLLVMIISISMLALWGCPKNAEVTATPEEQKETAPAVKEEPKPVAPVTEEAKPEVKEETKERAVAGAAGLQPIYFDFDRSFIRDDAKSVMKANAEWLKANPKTKIRIEGNCDERGTKEYNQALGQRRATSAKKYLTDLGIAAKRISLISYGKEKPVCTEQNEECWQKNRRDDLVAE
jgi:peptidoglycan-associated lipoprotein